MPYIRQDRREFLDTVAGEVPRDAGELNYVITMLCRRYIRSKGERYQNYNDILGALEGVKLELYRRRIAAYEDVKIEENGDVYDDQH